MICNPLHQDIHITNNMGHLMTDLSIDVAGLHLRNPVMTAAGPTSRDGATLLAAAAGGAGGLVVKTVSRTPASVPTPNMVAIGRGRAGSRRGMLNAERWSELPLERWVKREYRIALSSGLCVIASIGYTPEDVAHIGPMVERAGVHAIEFSTHYVGGHAEIARVLRESVSIPIFAKLSPTADVAKTAKSVEPFVDGIVAINTYGPCLRIDIETGRPMLGSEGGMGWLSGPALRPIALGCVAEIASSVRVPVVGVGGVSSGEDAIEFFMAGATAVEVCTAAVLEGPTVYGRIATEISRWLDAHGLSSVHDIVGTALPHLKSPVLQQPPATVDPVRCTLCGLCPSSCVYEAITLDRAASQLMIDTERCTGCGLCVSVCPQRAITLS